MGLFFKRYWKAISIAAALVFLYAGMLMKVGYDWWTDENYSHGLLIPFVIGYILWIERGRLTEARQNPSSWLGGAAILLAVFALWAGVAGAELYLQRLSLVLMLAGIMVYFWGLRLLRFTLVPLLLLFLALPVPVIVLNKIAFPLQLFASRFAVASMQTLGIAVLRQGNVIELMPRGALTTKKLEVVEACSGIRSLMTLVTLAVLYAWFTFPSDKATEGRRESSGGLFARIRTYGFWRSAILVLSAIPIAIVTNALRVSGTGVLSHYYGTRVADGFFHTFSGWVVYIAAFLLLFAVGWTLDRLNGLAAIGTEPGALEPGAIATGRRFMRAERTPGSAQPETESEAESEGQKLGAAEAAGAAPRPNITLERAE